MPNNISEEFQVEVFYDFYQIYLERNKKLLQNDCPRWAMRKTVFCIDMCMDVEELQVDHGEIVDVCPCFHFGCDEAWKRLEKFLRRKGKI